MSVRGSPECGMKGESLFHGVSPKGMNYAKLYRVSQKGIMRVDHIKNLTYTKTPTK